MTEASRPFEQKGFLPEQVLIEAYREGGFRFGNMSHRGSLLALPSGMWAWDAKTVQDLTATGFSPVFEDAAAIELLLVGTGGNMQPLSQELRQSFTTEGIRLETMTTGAACRTYNVLLQENRKVAAALLAID